MLAFAIAAAAPGVDGDLGEWTGDPFVVLGPEGRVAGEAPSGPDDLTAQVWLSAAPDGLWIAARVRDDRVLLPGAGSTGRRVVRSDHLELHVSLSDPPLPPFVWGARPVDGTFCEELSHMDGCAAWVTGQRALRDRLGRAFRLQVLLSDNGLQPVRDGDPAPAVGRSVVRPGPDGWTVEAFLPRDAMPAVARTSVGGARVLVELVDNDVGHDRQESFLSSRPGRAIDDPATWGRVPVGPPWTWDGPVQGALLAEGSPWWVEPGTPGQVHGLSPARLTAYSFGPDGDHLVAHHAAVPAEPTETHGSVALWRVPLPGGRTLLVSRGTASGWAVVRGAVTVRLADGLVVASRTTEVGEFARRPGSAASAGVVDVLTVGADGALVHRGERWEEDADTVQIARRDGRIVAIGLGSSWWGLPAMDPMDPPGGAEVLTALGEP